ncbi:MAG: hypothetical protein ACRDQ1_08165 [Sciscionella sp.]
MRISLATRPGSPDKPTEDFVAACPGVALILDGLSSPPDLGTGCVHGTPWYVAQLGTRLLAGAATRPAESLEQITADVIEAVAALHRGTCDLAHPGTPSSSIALLRQGAEQIDYLSVFDSVIVLATACGPRIVTDLRVDSYAQDEHKATTQYAIGTEEHRLAVSRLVAAQRPFRNQPHGYWVAGAVAETARHAVTGSVPRDEVSSAAILSDGASCLVDRFGAGDWARLLDRLGTSGPDIVLDQVRAVEESDPLGERWPRYKRSDDATVVFWEFDPV